MPTDNEICVAAAERWTQCMLRGDFASAWRESDLIEQTGYRDPHKLWNGEAWAGKRIMLRCLHGLGDCIQFVRYAPLLKKTCRYLTVQSHPELVRLMKQVPGVDQAVTWGEGECDWELQMEVMELPRAFRTTIPTIPGQVPYIYISEEQRRWAAQLFHEGHSLRVGLVWQSSAWNTERCIPVAELDPLLSNGRCKFYSLQKGSHAGIRGCDVQRHARDVADHSRHYEPVRFDHYGGYHDCPLSGSFGEIGLDFTSQSSRLAMDDRQSRFAMVSNCDPNTAAGKWRLGERHSTGSARLEQDDKFARNKRLNVSPPADLKTA